MGKHNKVKKILAKLPSGYEADVASLGEEALKVEIIKAEERISDIKQSEEEDQKLAGARELAKELAAPYADAVAAQRAKIDYVLHVLSSRGVRYAPLVDGGGEDLAENEG